jgi:hypothetical protein
MDRRSFISLSESKQGLLEKLRILQSSELVEYQKEALRLFGVRKMPNRGEAQLIEILYYKTLKEKNKREEDLNYYKANLQGFWNTIHWALNDDFLTTALVNHQPGSGKDMFITNWYWLLFGLLKDAVSLLELFEHRNKLTPDDDYLIFKEPIHHFNLYREMSRVLFAKDPFERFVPHYIGLLRQLIELRIRHAVGILGRIEVATGAFVPVPMKLIFDVLNKYALEKKIQFDVPIKNVERIYGWSNIHVHSGLHDFSWKYLIAYKYLGPLMLGKNVRDSPNYGIQTDRDTLEEIRRTVAERLEEKRNEIRRKKTKESRYDLWLTEPALLLTNANPTRSIQSDS